MPSEISFPKEPQIRRRLRARFRHRERIVWKCTHTQDERIFKTMLGLPNSHEKKMFKVPNDDFRYNVGQPQGKVGYSVLSITGTDVNVRWSPEEKTFKVSGTYGV